MSTTWRATLGMLPPGTPEIMIRLESEALNATLLLAARDVDTAVAANAVTIPAQHVAPHAPRAEDSDGTAMSSGKREIRAARRPRSSGRTRTESGAEGKTNLTASSLAQMAGMAVSDMTAEIARQVEEGEGLLATARKRGRGWVVDKELAQQWLRHHGEIAAA